MRLLQCPSCLVRPCHARWCCGRWAIAIIPEVRTILAYYTDGGTLKVYRWVLQMGAHVAACLHLSACRHMLLLLLACPHTRAHACIAHDPWTMDKHSLGMSPTACDAPLLAATTAVPLGILSCTPSSPTPPLFACSKSPWEDTAVSEKHRVLMQYVKRHRWLPEKEYASMVDVVMDAPTFTQYLASHLDVRVLEEAKRELPYNHDDMRECPAGCRQGACFAAAAVCWRALAGGALEQQSHTLCACNYSAVLQALKRGAS